MAQSDGGREWGVGRYTDHRHRRPFGLGSQYESHSKACRVGRLRGAACLPAPTAEAAGRPQLFWLEFLQIPRTAPATPGDENGRPLQTAGCVINFTLSSVGDLLRPATHEPWPNFSASGFIIRMYLDIRPKHGRSDGSAPPCCSDGGLSRYAARAVTGESTGRSHLGKRRFAAARNSEPEHT